MRTCIVLLLIFIMAFGFSVPAAHALSCAPPRAPIEELEYSEMVFKGRLISQTNERLTFAVSKAWKGDVSESVTLFKNFWTEFNNGEEYIVFAGISDGKMRPMLCGNTGLAAGFNEQTLGESIALEPRSSYAMQAAVATVSGAVIVIAVGLIALKRRSGN